MIIYKITNIITGKIYIGKKIWDKNKFLKTNYFGTGKYIKNSLKKYGIENFTREIIEECFGKKELSSREKYWIKYFNSKVPNGFVRC